MRRDRACSLCLAAWAFCTSACGLEFPEEFRIEDLRILDLEVDPPEITFFESDPDDPLSLDLENLPPFNLEPVRVSALAAHPDLAATFRYDWFRCGISFQRVPCEDYPRERIDESPEQLLSFSPVQVILDDALQTDSDFVDVALALTEDPRDLINGFYLHINAQVAVDQAAISADTGSLEATKRLVIFDPRVVNLVISESLGFKPSDIPDVPGLDIPQLCTGADPGKVNLIRGFLERRIPNQRPVLEGVLAGIRGRTETTTVTITSGETVVLQSGESLSLRGVPSKESEEAYVSIDANCGLQDFEEVLAYSWFTNSGDLSRQITTEENRITNWEPPIDEDQRVDRYRIYTVLRDGRGGSDSAWFDVIYE